MFTSENTTGYSAEELAALNEELRRRIADAGAEPGSDEAVEIEKSFNDEVSRRL